MLLKKGFLTILVCLLLTSVFSQSSKLPRTLKVSFGLSGFSYLGDFASGNGRFQRVYPGATLYIYTESAAPLQLQLGGGFGKFAAQYEGSNISPNQLTHTFVETPFYFSDLRLRYRFLKGNWRPYAALGAGILVFSPRDENGKPLKYMDESREEGEVYNTIIPEVPLSLGIEKTINELVNIGFEYTLRYTPTDYLDNVGQKGSKPGKDLLHAVSLTLSVALPNKNKQVDLAATSAPMDSSYLIQIIDTAEQSTEVVLESPSITTDSTTQSDEIMPSKSTASTVRPERAELIQHAINENRFFYYKVRKGDTLERLTETYNIDQATLRKVNFLKNDSLKKGTYLRIPDVE